MKYGIELESVYPYTAETDTCVYSAKKIIPWKNTGFKDVPAN